jgi:hypothetical protein
VLLGVLGVVLPPLLRLPRRTSSGGWRRIIARASMVGGQLGTQHGRRLHPTVLSGVIAVVGVTAIVRLLVT